MEEETFSSSGLDVLPAFLTLEIYAAIRFAESTLTPAMSTRPLRLNFTFFLAAQSERLLCLKLRMNGINSKVAIFVASATYFCSAPVTSRIALPPQERPSNVVTFLIVFGTDSEFRLRWQCRDSQLVCFLCVHRSFYHRPIWFLSSCTHYHAPVLAEFGSLGSFSTNFLHLLSVFILLKVQHVAFARSTSATRHGTSQL